MCPSQVTQMRTALNPAALTPFIVACVHWGLPQAVSPETWLLIASIWFPIFQPGAIARNTISGVMAVAVAGVMALPASSERLTVTVSLPQEMVIVPFSGDKVRLAAAETDTVVS